MIWTEQLSLDSETREGKKKKSQSITHLKSVERSQNENIHILSQTGLVRLADLSVMARMPLCRGDDQINHEFLSEPRG